MNILFLILLPFIGGLLAFGLPRNSQRKVLLIGVSLMHFACVFRMWGDVVPAGSPVLMPETRGSPDFLGMDVLGRLVLTVISFLFAAVSVYIWGYLKNGTASNRIFIGCSLLLLSSMTLVTASVHMGLLWVALEATTLMSAPLINFERSAQSTEAAWKYILICSVGIALALLGTIMLAISTGSLKTVFLNELLAHAAVLDQSWLKVSMVFLLIGYGTKMGLAPMQTWKPDTYSQAPAPIGALMSGALTACPILAVLRLIEICNRAHLKGFIESILIVLGVLSLGVAAVFMLRQRDLSRMLAYSSVENMGIIALGLGLGQASYWPSLFLFINNALTKGLIFMVAGNLYQHYRSRQIEQIQAVSIRLPIMGIFLMIGFLSLSGIPPLGTFYSEVMILMVAIGSRHYVTAVMMVVFLSIIFIGMAQGFLHMFHDTSSKRQENLKIVLPASVTLPVIVLGTVLLSLGLHIPQSLENTLQASKELLGG